MRQYTTPSLRITLKDKHGQPVTDMDFDYILVTFRCGDYLIEREVKKAETEQGVFTITLTQEETAGLTIGRACDVELNIMAGTARIGTQIKRVSVDRNLHEEVIFT